MRYIALIIALLWTPVTFAQSVPNGGSTAGGTVWTPAQWMNAWQSKIDTTNGTSLNQTLNGATLNNPVLNGFSFTGGTITNPTITGGSVSGSVVSDSNAVAAGGTFARSLAAISSDQISVLAFTGVNNDVRAVTSACSVTSGQSVVNCSGVSFTSADVGKSALMLGMGTSGGITPTTITTVTDSSHVTLAATAANTVSNGTLFYGTDSTAGLTNAISWAQTNKKTLYFPDGLYWLASSASTITLRNMSLRASGAATVAGGFYTGAILLISNQVTPQFSLAPNVNWNGLSVLYPAQDGETPTPIVYPALFQAAHSPLAAVNNLITNFNFINPYTLLQADDTSSGSALGRVTFSKGRGYCVAYCVNLTGGGADIVDIDSSTYWSVGAASDLGAGNAYLPKWTAANGEFLHVDIGAATKSQMDGFIISPQIVHGYKYGVRVLSGQLGATITAPYMEVSTLLSVEGTGSFDGGISVPGWVYGHNPYDDSTNENVINLGCSGADTVLNITNTYFKYGSGNFIENGAANCIHSLTVTGNTFHNWGASTTAGSYYGIHMPSGSATKTVAIANNVFDVVSHAGSPERGLYFGHCNGQTTITGNTIINSFVPLTDACTDSGALIVNGNTSITTSASSTSIEVTSTHSPTVMGNQWDRPLVSTIDSGFGTSPSISCQSDWHSCTITVGTSPGGSGVVDLPWTQTAAPVCVANDNTTAVALKASSTTSAVTITGAMVAADKVALVCSGH